MDKSQYLCKLRLLASSVLRSKSILAYAFLFPAIFVVVSVVIYPLIRALNFSFYDIDLRQVTEGVEWGAATIQNYINLFQSPDFWRSFKFSFLFTFYGVSISFLIGLGIALLLNQEFKGRKLVRLLLILPWVVPSAAASLVWLWIFNPTFGVLNYFLEKAHIISSPVPWLMTPTTAFIAVVTVLVWKNYPFFILMLLAGLQVIPKELYDAAQVDGANKFKIFIHITLPALRSVSMISIILSVLWVFREFATTHVLTGGGPVRSTEVLPLLLYREAFKFLHIGYGSAIGIITLIVCLVITLSLFALSKKEFY